MAAHHHFSKKCLQLDIDLSGRLSSKQESLDYSEQFMGELLKSITPEALLRNILDSDTQDISIKKACYHAMHVEEVSRPMVQLAIAISRHHDLYNRFLDHVDSHHFAGKMASDHNHESTAAAITRLRIAGKSRQSLYRMPQYKYFASAALSAALVSGISLEQVLSQLHVPQIHAHAEPLLALGIRLFSDERMANSTDYPFYYLDKCSQDEIAPTFDLLESLHGPIFAHKILSEVLKSEQDDFCYLSAEQILNSFAEPTPIAALRRFISSKDGLYAQPLKWLVTALKKEHRWAELDDLNKRESKYLLDQRLLSSADLQHLPALTRLHVEKRFCGDLGL